MQSLGHPFRAPSSGKSDKCLFPLSQDLSGKIAGLSQGPDSRFRHVEHTHTHVCTYTHQPILSTHTHVPQANWTCGQSDLIKHVEQTC